MYAVIKLGASQFKVAEGDTIEVNKIKSEEGKNVTLENVLLFAKGSDVRIGQPHLKDVKVTAKVVKHLLDEKQVAFKYRRRKDSSTKIGHRQKLTMLNITKIAA